MKKRILAVVLALSMVFSFLPFGVFAADTDTTITFNLGADGTASHYDGPKALTSYEEEVDGYTLSIAATQQMWPGARDAKGNGCIKLGAKNSAGKFTINVPDDVEEVILNIAGYKANTAKITVNSTSYTISTLSNNGDYTAISVDTSSTKTVTFTTVSGGYRAMMNSIDFVIPGSGSGEAECEHNYDSVVTDATCTEDGFTTYTCSLCGDSYVADEKAALGHDFVAGEVVPPTETEQGYTIYACSRCDATENRDYTDPTGNIVEKEIEFQFGSNGSASHKDGSTDKSTYSDNNGDYTLSITGGSKFYPSSYDAKGNSAIKLGSSSAEGKFTFTVEQNNVKKVILNVAGYKANTAKISVNGTPYTINTLSDNGEYTAIEVDTSSEKTVTFTTVSGGYRAMMDSIIFVATEVSVCEHSYTFEVTTAATCTEKGEKTFTCTLCGDSYTEEIDATGHSFVANETVDPTETEVGYTNKTCSACGATEKGDFIAPIDPALPDNQEKVIFTFGENGDATHTDGDALTAPKEYAEGDYFLTFTTLTKVYGGSFDAKGNSAIKLGTGDDAATLEFTVSDKVKTVIIRIAGYKSNDAVFTVNGGEEQTVSLHSDDGLYMPIVIDTTETKTITLSTTTKAERALIDSITYYASTSCEHSYESVTTEATCTEAGKTVYTCSKCGDSYEETITATGHSYESVVTAPTCTEAGYTTYTCLTCGDSYKGEETAAAGHSYNEVVTAPTCTEAGKTVYTCSKCGDSYEETITATGHSYESSVTAPTCTADGYTTYTCSCGDTYVSDTVAALGHDYETIKVDPSATDTGYKKHICIECGDTYVSDPVLLKNGKVQNVTTTTEGDAVAITWDALTAVDKYIVYIYAMDGTLIKCAQKVTNRAAFADIDVGEYVVIVIAKTTKGWSNYLYADEVPFTISEPETEQGPLASAGEITPNYVTITWPAVDGAIKYFVRIVGGEDALVRSATTNSIKVYGLKPSTQYEVSVCTKTAEGYSDYGPACTITTAGVANATLSIQSLNSSSVTLTWDAVPNGDKYFIKLTGEDGTRCYKTTSTSITINGLNPEKSYTVAICTRTLGKNYSEYSSNVTFTTPAPEGIAISSQVKADGVHLSWTSGLSFDKVWVKEVLSDGTIAQHASLSDGADKFTVDVFQEGTREFFLIVRVITETGKKKYITTDSIFVTAPAPKEVEVATEADLKAALAAAQVGEIVKITLTADITATLADDAAVLFSVPKATDVILNLNGHTINATLPDNATAQNESVFIVNQDATLAVEGNGTINATVGTNGAGSYIFNNSGATLLLVDGNYNLTLVEGKKGFIVAIVDSNSTLGETKTTILDGNYKTSDNIGNMFRNFANHKTENCSLIIEGGNFTSNFSSSSYPKAVIWNQAPNTNAYGTGYVNIVRGSFSGLEVENDHPAENVTIGKKAFIGVYGTAVNPTNADELKAALANGGYIVLNGDVDLTAAEITGNVISENTVLDLNGYTLTYSAEYVSGMNGTQISAITVDNDATLVIGNGTVNADSAYGIYVKAGTLVIESGSYSAITSAVQVYNGSATINGGSFDGSETYLLNCIDSAYNNGDAKITVNGGKFVGFNPADNAAEAGGNTNFVAEGYKAIEKNGSYIVVTEDYEEILGVTTADELKAALNNGEKEIDIAANITLTEGLYATDVTFTGVTEDAGINFAGHNIMGSGSVTYKNLDLTTVSLPYAEGANGEKYGWYGGIDYNGHTVSNYENCEITGVFTTYTSTVNATGCTFNYYVQDGEEFYGMFLYKAGTVNATDCTFMYGDRAIKIYGEGKNDYILNLDDCKFVATEDYKLNKVLINIDSTYINSVELNIGTLDIDEKLSSLAIHNGEGNSKVTVSTLVDSGDEL